MLFVERSRRAWVLVAISMGCVACSGGDAPRAQDLPFSVVVEADIGQPWALEFLPDSRLLITDKRGRLLLRDAGGELTEVAGVPAVADAGQGGFGDILLHPEFERNSMVYLSYSEAGEQGLSGAAVARGQLELTGSAAPRLTGLTVIWRQSPKVTGNGHFSQRLAFGPDGFLWISSGERQKFDPAQDMNANLGKLIRLHADGSIPADNPFVADGDVAAAVWSLGHRNPLGIAFDAAGQLWDVEMGPRGGDELNRVVRGANYGYPIVSNGDHYNGDVIPDHDTRPEFAAPAISWNPSISPSSLLFYRGSEFPDWNGNALIGGLSSQAIIRVAMTADGVSEAARYPMGERIRGLEQAPDGSLWVIEDGSRGGRGRLLRLLPLPSASD